MAPTDDSNNSRVIERQQKNYSLERRASTKNIVVERYSVAMFLKCIGFKTGICKILFIIFFRPSPEYLVRTGSMKNKVIPSSSSTLPSKAQEKEDCRKKKGKQSNNYAFYNIQSGCFTWQGR